MLTLLVRAGLAGMRVTLLDSRQLVGRFMAFDKHMNLVLGDCEEFRYLPPKKGKDEDEVLPPLLSLHSPLPTHQSAQIYPHWTASFFVLLSILAVRRPSAGPTFQ